MTTCELPFLRTAPPAHVRGPGNVTPVPDPHHARATRRHGAVLSAACVRVRALLSRAARGVRGAPERIFGEYAYFSSYASSWVEHARAYCEQMVERFGIGRHSRVVEIASNDGYLLQHFVARGVSVLGVEPAANVAAVAAPGASPRWRSFRGRRANWRRISVMRTCSSAITCWRTSRTSTTSWPH